MPLVASPESAVERPIALRMRGDLEFCPQRFRGERYWAVKDPISLQYFHLREEEHAVLTMLDGRPSLDQVRRRLEQAFAPRTLGHLEVQGFLATLHRYGLVVAESAGQGGQLLNRQADRRRRRRYETLAGALAIRFPGVNPRRLLDALAPKCRFLFSRVSVVASLVLAIAALLLVTVEFETFRARLPDFRAILAASNLPWLVLALAVTKVLHELGHAVACRHFGGDCHEVGVMLLVFTPCLYCNVSGSWMLPSKWQRIAIAAAGMYVELILASICTFLWWFSQPGLFNALCLNTMLVCSVGTLVLNGNPLLRYDGYFILSDLVEVPNLRAQSTAAVRRLFAQWCLGRIAPLDRTMPARGRGLLVSYAIASSVYRWVIVIAVLWALTELARPYHLDPLVALVAGMTLVGMTWPAAAEAIRFMREPTHRRRIAPTRAALAGAVCAAALLAIALVKLPVRVAAPAVLEYRDAQRVYVTVPGKLTVSARIGQKVAAGQTLAQLENFSVRKDIARLTAQREGKRVYLADLEARRLQGVVDGGEIPAAKAALADAQQRLAQLEHDARELTVVAPTGGTVLPPPKRAPKSRASDKLEHWSGMPLEPRNLGSYLDVGTLLCLVGDPARFEAVLHVEQADIELVEVGQRVQVLFDHLPGQVFSGRITEIARLDLDEMPRELAAAGDLPARVDPQGVSHPLDTWYQARVVLDDDPPRLLAGAHGRAKISVASSSLLAQFTRWLKQTFNR